MPALRATSGTSARPLRGCLDVHRAHLRSVDRVGVDLEHASQVTLVQGGAQARSTDEDAVFVQRRAGRGLSWSSEICFAV
jgi:hypothetical protein